MKKCKGYYSENLLVKCNKWWETSKMTLLKALTMIYGLISVLNSQDFTELWEGESLLISRKKIDFWNFYNTNYSR